MNVELATPLHRQRRDDLHAAHLQLVVVGLHVRHLEEVLLHRPLLRGQRDAQRDVLPAEHDARAPERHGAEVELPILAEHSHLVPEPELVDVEAPGRVDRIDGDDGHHAAWRSGRRTGSEVRAPLTCSFIP